MDYDIAIIGGGIIGLTLALKLSMVSDFRILLLEAKEPSAFTADVRTSAINLAAKNLLDSIGVWSLLTDVGYYNKMYVGDANSTGTLLFNAHEMLQFPLGFIVLNYSLLNILWQLVNARPSAITVSCPVSCHALHMTDHGITIETATARFSTRLLIAADGGNSSVRNLLSIETAVKDYQQIALTGILHCEKTHQHTAWQNFTATGPIALLPLSDNHAVSFVWSQHCPAAQQLITLSHEELNKAITRASEGLLGHCELVSSLHTVPLIERHAAVYVKSRTVLIGDAAHTIHPLAGQGLNLGFADIDCLVRVLSAARDAGRDFSSLAVLKKYQRHRRSENAMMLAAMRFINAALSHTDPYLITARSKTMKLLNQSTTIKKILSYYANTF